MCICKRKPLRKKRPLIVRKNRFLSKKETNNLIPIISVIAQIYLIEKILD